MELKTKTLLFIVVSFLLGGVGGWFARTNFSYPNDGQRHSRSAYQKQFVERLKLDSTQAAQVDSIFEIHRSKFNEVKKQYSETIRLKRDTLRMEIRRILSPEQNKLYDEFIKEQDERQKKERERQGNR